MRCCGWIKHCFLNRHGLTWKVFPASLSAEPLTATRSCHMQPHWLTIQFSILSLSALFLTTFRSNLVSSFCISSNTEWQPVWACVTWRNVCVYLWLSSVTKYIVPSLWVQRPGLTLSHSISMPTCPLAPSARYTCLTWSYTLGRLSPFSLSRAVCRWPHCYSELLQMAWAQIASASSHPSQAAALRSSTAGARVPARSVTPPLCVGLRYRTLPASIRSLKRGRNPSLHGPDWERRPGCGLLMGPPRCASAPEASASVSPGTGHRLINLLK